MASGIYLYTNGDVARSLKISIDIDRLGHQDVTNETDA